MPTPVLFTTTEAIRSAVGVTTVEIPDVMLTDQQLESQISVDLYGWFPNYQTAYDEGSAPGADAAQAHTKNLLVMYCMFFGAVRVVEMIMAMRRSVGDGKSQVERFDVNWEQLLEVLENRRDSVKDQLNDLVNPGSGVTGLFGRAVPSYDPVTNS